jgi:REP element-mobilizing transposase RayT
MARKPRVHFPTALYHVILRGNGGQDIFFDDADRCRFLLLLQEGVERYGHRIHAFCLMSNHLHLAIQIGEIPLSRIMQNLSFRYTRWHNWRRKKTGHLFQGRFKAVLVDADSYLSELIRYIHLNPVRAGMANTLEEYSWSSHRAYLGSESIPWLTIDWTLAQFGSTISRARRNYLKFMDLGKDEGYRQEFHSGVVGESRILGEDSFVNRVLSQCEGRAVRPLTVGELAAAVCLEYRVSAQELATAGKYRTMSEARGMVAWLILETGWGTLAELGKQTGRDVTTLSAVAKQLRNRSMSDTLLAERMVRVKKAIDQIALMQA